MCLLSQKQEFCTHPECLSFYSSSICCAMPQDKDRLLESIIMMLTSRSSVLSSLCTLSKTIIEKVNSIEQFKKHSDVNNQPPAVSLLKEKTYQYKLQALGPIPSVVSKEKGFPLTLEVYDENYQKVYCEGLFKIKLFTNETPPKPLKLNISSRKIIRGTLESCMNSSGVICFENIVINEVSSHYINESFIMVISSELNQIKPLIINNLYVRARNSTKKNLVD
jgi:hypothetical protein